MVEMVGDSVGGAGEALFGRPWTDASVAEAASPPELYDVEIPISPPLLYQIGFNAHKEAVEVGGVYDDKIVAVAVYDRPWDGPEEPGGARVLGTIYISSRFDRVYRIEVWPGNGGTIDGMLATLRRLAGGEPEPAAGPGYADAP